MRKIKKMIFVFVFMTFLMTAVMSGVARSQSYRPFQSKSSNFNPPQNLVPSGKKLYDFDEDNKADFSFFTNGTWKIRQSSSSQIKTENFGTTGDVPVPEMYNSIPTASYIGVWRPSNATWYIDSFGTFQFGLSTDKPVPWDYDGDTASDLTVFRNGTWYIYRSSDQTVSYQYWGTAGDIPIMGYFFGGDAKGNVAVFRPSNSTWYALNSLNGSTKTRQFGTTGDLLVPADYDGDGLIDFAVFRSVSGQTSIWWILKSSDDNVINYDLGVGTDFAVPADYDGDGKTDAAVYRSSETKWYYLRSFNGDLVQVVFGSSGDVPVPNSLYR